MIGLGGKFFLHFNDGNVLSFLRVGQAHLAAGKAAADDDDVLSLAAGLVNQLVGRKGKLGKSRNSGDQRIASHRAQHIVRFHFLQHLPCYLGVQPNLHTVIVNLADQEITESHHVLLVAVMLQTIQCASQTALLFQQGHIMAPALRGKGGRQASGTSADHHHLALVLGRGVQVHIQQLMAHGGVHVTAKLAHIKPPDAVEAADTGNHVLLPSGAPLVGCFRVSQQLPGHIHNIRIAVPDDPVHLGGVVVAAHSGHLGLFDRLLHSLRRLQIAAVGDKDSREGVLVGGVVGASGNMDNVHILFCQLGVLAHILQGDSVFHVLVAAHPQLNDEVLAHSLPDSLVHPQGEPGPVFQRAAVLIRAVVGSGREELGEQPAMAAVNHDHLEAAALHL